MMKEVITIIDQEQNEVMAQMQFENKYSCDEEFFKEFYSYYFFRRPIFAIVYIMLLIVFVDGVLGMIFPGSFLSNGTIWPNVAGPLFLGIFIYFRYSNIRSVKYRQAVEVNDGLELKITITIIGDDIHYESALGETSINFDKVKRIRKTKNYILFITPRKSVFVFKKDGFTKGTYEEFDSMIRSRFYNE